MSDFPYKYISKAGYAVTIIALWLAIIILILHDRNEAYRVASISSQNLALAFEEHVLCTFEDIDNLLKHLRTTYYADQSQFHREVSDYLSSGQSESIIKIGIIGKRGKLEFASKGNIDKNLDLSDREHFKVHQYSGEDYLFVSRPVTGRVTGVNSIQFTRRLQNRDGTFAGVIVASMPTDYFNNFFSRIDVGRKGAIAIVGMDRYLRLRISPVKISENSFSEQLPRDAQVFDLKAPQSGIFKRIRQFDKVESLISYERLNRYPLAVIVTLAEEDIYRDSSVRRNILLAIGVLITAILTISLFYILKQRRIQQTLVQNLYNEEAKFRLLAEFTPAWEYWVNQDVSKVLYCSPSSEEITGYTPQEFYNNPSLLNDIITELSSACYEEHLKVVHTQRSEHNGVRRYEIQIRTKQGAIKWISHRCRAIQDCTGTWLGTRVSCEDITEMKAIETELRIAKEEAERAERIKSEFLSTMTHELRTPMNGILGMAQLLELSSLDEDQKQYVELMKSSGRRLMELINDILDISRIESGKMKLDRTELSPALVLYEVAELHKPEILKKNLSIQVNIAEDIPSVIYGDQKRLWQIMNNLLGNAVKFTEKGEITLALEIISEDIHTVALSISVTDTGIGIPKGDLKRIFEPFEQGDTSITRRFGGSGLGLPICMKIIELMNGKLVVSENSGGGTRFEVELTFEKVIETSGGDNR